MIVHESGALRRRVAHLIDTVTFDPPGMSPSSILLVRRLADPLPRRLAPHLEAVRADSEWERAARSRLSDFHRRAVCPIQGVVSGAADAVIFADQSEMLACLARDIVSGNAAMFWWWRAILRALPAGMIEALVAAWRRDARYIPAALHLLHARGEALRVLNSISPTQSWSLLQEIAREFGISLPSLSTASPIHASQRQQDSPPAKSDEERRLSLQHAQQLAFESTAPWRELTFLEALPDSFGRERSALLGISLLLHRAPQVARAAGFTERFFAWYQSAKTQKAERSFLASTPALASQASAAQAASSPVTISPLMPAEQHESSQSMPAVANDRSQMPVVMAQEEPSNTETQARTGATNRATESSAITEALKQNSGYGVAPIPQTPAQEKPQNQIINANVNHERLQAARAVASGTATSELSAILPAPEVQAPQLVAPVKPADGEPVPTELGGVLFLVNLLLALKLPESLESEFGVGPVSGWDLLELLARSLLGERAAALANDGVWSVLGQLAGRSPDVPLAAEFQPQQCYRIPPSWLGAIGPKAPQVFGVRSRANHLQLWHQQGFALADCLINNALSRQSIEEECSLHCGIGVHPQLASWRKIARHALVGCRNFQADRVALRRFMAFLLPYVRWRLCLALGISNAHALPETLLLRRGRLYVTRTHVDLVMHLNQATPEVRMSGLDADPGWVPSLGRVIKFSFVAEAWG